MIELKTPRGLAVRVPEDLSEDPTPRFSLADAQAAREYYLAHGYVVFKSLYSTRTCDTIRRLWDDEVKPYRGYIYRQASSGEAETHVKNAAGWIMNPILNLQSVDPREFPTFRDFSTREILAHKPLNRVFTALLEESPKIVQSMYFEGNSATWEHQDSYYLDSEIIGEMCAAWIALEDITARAGRFFICPGSHKIKLDDHSLYNNIAVNHDTYIRSVVDQITVRDLEIHAPVLEKGDVLLWNSLTIHGSLDTQDPAHSRSSITCHAIPRSRRFLQLQTRLLTLATDEVDGTAIYRPKDLAVLKNRVVFFIETHFPRMFYWLKKQAILYFVRQKTAAAT
jgi:phytanoyl-CoA hydroxylase